MASTACKANERQYKNRGSRYGAHRVAITAENKRKKLLKHLREHPDDETAKKALKNL